MIDNILELLCIAIAVSAVSIVVTKATIFGPLRQWIMNKSEFFGELFSCPLCFSFYVTILFDLFIGFRLFNEGFDDGGVFSLSVPVNLVVSYFAIIGMAAIFSGIIYNLLSKIR